MKFILLLFLLFVPAVQSPVEPVRVSVTTLAGDEANQYERELAGHIRDRLRESRRVVITERRADFNIFVAAALVPDGCSDYAAAFLVIKGDNSRPSLTLLAGKQLQPLARQMVEKLERERFSNTKAGR